MTDQIERARDRVDAMFKEWRAGLAQFAHKYPEVRIPQIPGQSDAYAAMTAIAEYLLDGTGIGFRVAVPAGGDEAEREPFLVIQKDGGR